MGLQVRYIQYIELLEDSVRVSFLMQENASTFPVSENLHYHKLINFTNFYFKFLFIIVLITSFVSLKLSTNIAPSSIHTSKYVILLFMVRTNTKPSDLHILKLKFFRNLHNFLLKNLEACFLP